MTTDPRPDIPFGRSYDEQGNELTHKNSDGYWHEFTYDAAGRLLTCKRSDGHWYARTYDTGGHLLTFEDGFVSSDH